MKKLILWFLAFLTVLVFVQTGSAETILFDYAFNIDGDVSVPLGVDPVPGNVNIGSFDETTGLGTIAITVSDAGAHYVGGFFDHEIFESTNTFFNEFGSTYSTSDTVQTWEIDEPEYVFGDIWTNFSSSSLDNSNNVPAGSEDDVSMAMAWNFTLAAGEDAAITFILSEIAPVSGFYLAHTDKDSNESIYFSSTLKINADPIPEPSTMILFGAGLLGLACTGRRRN